MMNYHTLLLQRTHLCHNLIDLILHYTRIQNQPTHIHPTYWSIIQRRYPTALTICTDGTLLALTSAWRVFVIPPHTPSYQWTLPTNHTAPNPTLFTSLTYSPRYNHILVATPHQINLYTPTGLWQRHFHTAGNGPIAASPYGEVFLGTQSHIRVYDERSGRLRRTLHWTQHTNAATAATAITHCLALEDERLWVTGGTDTHTWITALHPHSGQLLLQWLWPQKIISLALAPTGDLWVTYEHTPGFTVLHRTTGQTLYTIGGKTTHHEHNTLAVGHRGEALVLNAFSGIIKVYE